MTRYYTINGQILGQRDSSGTYTGYMQDALGSVTGTTDVSGNLENTYRWAGYGTQISKTGTADDPKFLWNGTLGYRQTGRQYAGVYVRRRHYGREQSAWTTLDAYWPQARPWAYCAGKPTRRTDASGALSVDVITQSPAACAAPCTKCTWITSMKLTRSQVGDKGWLVQNPSGVYIGLGCASGLADTITPVDLWEAWQVKTVDGKVNIYQGKYPQWAELYGGNLDIYSYVNANVCDFGLGGVIGTIKYFSDEELKGQPDTPDTWTPFGNPPDWALPTTWTEPPWFNKLGSLVYTKSWELGWECCGSPGVADILETHP